MRQKCPKCGEWCYAEERSSIEKYRQPTIVEKFVGGLLGTIIDPISQYDCFFHCENCDYVWGANVDEDQSEELDAEEQELIAKISEKVQEIKDEKDYKAIA